MHGNDDGEEPARPPPLPPPLDLDVVLEEALHDRDIGDDEHEPDEWDALEQGLISELMPPKPEPPPPQHPQGLEASSSSSSAPPPPPQHPQGLEGDSIIPYDIPGYMPGRVTWYSAGQRFIVKCSNRAHGRCQKSITTRGPFELHTESMLTYNPAQGRSAGFAVAWSIAGRTVNKEDHMQHTPDRESRWAARRGLKKSVQGLRILNCERFKVEDEESEPEGNPAAS